MTFLSPLWLLGLGFLLIPLVIHLLFKRRFVVVEWAAAEFLLKAFQKQKRKLVLENVLLMILRMLILGLLATAFAVPVLKSFLVSGFGEGTGTTVIILDNSYSMNAEFDGENLFETAKRHCVGIVRKSGGSRNVHLLLLAESENSGISSFDSEFIINRINDAEVSYASAQPRDALEQAQQIFKESGSGTLYIVTDLQRTTWGFSGESENGIILKDISSRAAVRIVGVHSERLPENAGIESLSLEDRPSTEGRKSKVQAVIRNFTSKEKQVTVTFSLNGEVYGEKKADLNAYESKPVHMEILFEKAGTAGVEVQIEDDDLLSDNRMFLPVETAQSVEILAVNGETSVEVMKDETDFFRKAMNPGGTFSVTDDIIINVTDVDETGFGQKDIYGFDLVVLANIMRIPAQKVETLKSYIREGGAVLFSGGELIDSEFYNANLYSDGGGVFPCPLGKTLKRKNDFSSYATFDIKTLKGSMLRFLSRFKSNISEHIHFFRYFAVPETENDPFSVVLRFSDGTPAVVEQTGTGISCFLNFTLDEQWSTFPSHPLYLPFFREIVNYCVIRGQTRFADSAGEPLTARIPAESSGGEFSIRGPGVSADGLKPLFSQTQYIIGWEKTGQPGFYSVEGQNFSELFSRNHRPAESRINYLNDRELTEEYPFVQVEITGREKLLTGLEGEGRNIWRFLAVTAFIIFIAEFLFAYYQSKR